MPDRADRLSRLVRSRPAALALIVLGVIAIVAGLLQTTTSHLNGGNVPCPNGTTLVAKFDFGGGKYHFEEPAGNEHVVTITHGSATGGTWDSQIAIAAVVVKGGPDAVITSVAPPALHGLFSNAGLPLVGKGNHPDVSNVQFCAPIGETSTTSTSTVPHSTTTTHPTTTTTVTVPSSTTTTETPVTEATTVEPTTTTTHPTTTTETVAPTTTTTVIEPPPVTEATTVPNGASTAAGSTSTVPGRTTPTTVFDGAVTSTTIVVAPAVAGSGTNSLPWTGSPSLPLIALGAVLLTAGAALVIVGRRRHWA
ncbi:MAG TPA: hypothetical protein VEZ15_12590 [Acidimicrobiia bacterium]|nr:hypothetical protein [Acidimicrobiia bacterium]